MSAQTPVMSVAQARELAVRADGDQRDRDGSFHINHVARVAEAVLDDEAHQRVAWLHDVIEDSGMTAGELGERLGTDEPDALVLLTHHDAEEPYVDYVSRIFSAPGRAGELARAVKQADMLDNVRPCIRDHDPAIAQYGSALAELWSPSRP